MHFPHLSTTTYIKGNELGIDQRRIEWKRVLDMNDRALRHVNVGLGGTTHGVPRRWF